MSYYKKEKFRSKEGNDFTILHPTISKMGSIKLSNKEEKKYSSFKSLSGGFVIPHRKRK